MREQRTPRLAQVPLEPHASSLRFLQANETFAFVGNVTHYAEVWLNISAEIRSFLEQGRLQQHLHWLQQVLRYKVGGHLRWALLPRAEGYEPHPKLNCLLQYVADLRLHPEAMNLSLEELPPALRQDNFSLPNGTALLQQLDTIDNAACGWIQFMSKVRWVSTVTALSPCAFSGLAPTMAPFQVSVDIFKGFPDEESIVNYTLNQAYQDNVTVFASEFLPSHKGPVSPIDLLPHQLGPTLSLLCSVTFLLLGPDLFTTSMSSHISPFLPSLAHLGPTLRLLALPHPLFLFRPAPPLSETPHLSHYLSWNTHFAVCPIPSMPSGHTLLQPPVPRRDLPDPEGWLPPSARALQDSPELKLHRENQ